MIITFGYGGANDAAHRRKMESIASTLTPEQRQWFLKTTLAPNPKRPPWMRLRDSLSTRS